MAELDPELLERVARWCAEAGRQTGQAEIRAALAPLGWDELLQVKALLADPPPARPLGPFALADVARGAPADVAAERERGGMYRREEAEPTSEPPAAGSPPPRASARRATARGARSAAVVIRRARDRAPALEPAAPALPLLDELRLPGGRAALERLVRRHGGRRAVIARELAARYRRADGAPVGEGDLATLLDLHGALRAFERRERDELLHAVRAVGGVLARAAERLGLEPTGLGAAVDRLGLAAEVERVREERRAELRGRALLSERVHLLLDDPVRLEDLGLLDELLADLRARLPEHVRALRAAPGPLGAALAASLSLDRAAVEALEARFGLALGGAPWRGAEGGARTTAPPRPRTPTGGFRPGGPPGARASSAPFRRGPARPGGAPSPRPRSDGLRPPANPRPAAPNREGSPPGTASPGRPFRPAGPPPPRGAGRGPAPARSSDPRSGARPSGSGSGARSSYPRGGARPPGSRGGAGPSDPRGGGRPSGPRSGARSSDLRGGARPSGPRSGARPSGPRSGARPSGPRRPPRRP